MGMFTFGVLKPHKEPVCTEVLLTGCNIDLPKIYWHHVEHSWRWHTSTAYIFWTAALSLLLGLPSFNFVGLTQYESWWITINWITSITNLGIVWFSIYGDCHLTWCWFSGIAWPEYPSRREGRFTIYLYNGAVIHCDGYGVEMDS